MAAAPAAFTSGSNKFSLDVTTHSLNGENKYLNSNSFFCGKLVFYLPQERVYELDYGGDKVLEELYPLPESNVQAGRTLAELEKTSSYTNFPF